ncbi:YpoC family protein [Jeotgalibacillus malaysiensis]|uniref:YpoC family protein n=1 Tax=Jeotgalibacillus malaysiensis TaxID=1508404 RepID=UPI0038509EEA
MKYILPDQYKHPLFYQPDHVEVEIDDKRSFDPYFAEDLLARHHQVKPWEDIESCIGSINEEWKVLSDEMRPLFEGQAEKTFDSMVKGISLFFTLLYWTNEKHVSVSTWAEDIKHFEVSIMNPHERISFVMKRPAVYFSFIQLDEMFRELTKTSAKFAAIKKRKRGI